MIFPSRARSDKGGAVVGVPVSGLPERADRDGLGLRPRLSAGEGYERQSDGEALDSDLIVLSGFQGCDQCHSIGHPLGAADDHLFAPL